MKYVAILLMLSFVLVACQVPTTQQPVVTDTPSQETVEEPTPTTTPQAEVEAEDEEVAVSEPDKQQAKDPNLPVWMTISFKDVMTGETLTISDYLGKPILFESFAVWCPLCTQQQREVKEFHEQEGDSFVSLSLDTDPNEDEAKVREHVTSNSFEDSVYAVSPVELTRSLIDEFGVGIVNAPSVPMVLVCPDGSFKKLKNGHKSISYLKEQIAEC